MQHPKVCHVEGRLEMLDTILKNIAPFKKRIVVFVASSRDDPKFRRMREMLYARGYYTLYLDDEASPSETAPVLVEFNAAARSSGGAARFEDLQVKILCASHPHCFSS